MEAQCLKMFGSRLKGLRQERGLTIEEFSNKVGISKSSVGYYENQNRVPDIVIAGKMANVLNVSTDYLIGRSNARTQEPKLKSICDKTGLSDKSVLMLARLKKENNPRLQIINLLLEQADSDIEDDYELEGSYEGSVLNALCRYIDIFNCLEEYELKIIAKSDILRGAVYQLIFNQAAEALRKLKYKLSEDS